VDDDDIFLTLAEKVFRKNGVTTPIQKVHDGVEAIAYLKGEGKFSDRNVYEFPRSVFQSMTSKVG
jgi:CheY-like chemotaxis protein